MIIRQKKNNEVDFLNKRYNQMFDSNNDIMVECLVIYCNFFEKYDILYHLFGRSSYEAWKEHKAIHLKTTKELKIARWHREITREEYEIEIERRLKILK